MSWCINITGSMWVQTTKRWNVWGGCSLFEDSDLSQQVCNTMKTDPKHWCLISVWKWGYQTLIYLYWFHCWWNPLWTIKQYDRFIHILFKAVLPILIAVSCLSPVRIQILMSAFISVSIVSGTLSWSLSSMAVAPSSCRFYTQNEQETQKEKGGKKSVRGDYNRGRPLKRQVSKKHVCRDCVTHSVVVFPSSAARVYHAERPQLAFRGIGYSTTHVCACICKHYLCHTSTATQYAQCWFFFQGTWWFFGLDASSYWAKNRVKYLTRPRSRGETGASSRGKAVEALIIVTWSPLHVHL